MATIRFMLFESIYGVIIVSAYLPRTTYRSTLTSVLYGGCVQRTLSLTMLGDFSSMGEVRQKGRQSPTKKRKGRWMETSTTIREEAVESGRDMEGFRVTRRNQSGVHESAKRRNGGCRTSGPAALVLLCIYRYFDQRHHLTIEQPPSTFRHVPTHIPSLIHAFDCSGDSLCVNQDDAKIETIGSSAKPDSLSIPVYSTAPSVGVVHHTRETSKELPILYPWTRRILYTAVDQTLLSTISGALRVTSQHALCIPPTQVLEPTTICLVSLVTKATGFPVVESHITSATAGDNSLGWLHDNMAISEAVLPRGWTEYTCGHSQGCRGDYAGSRVE